MSRTEPTDKTNPVRERDPAFAKWLVIQLIRVSGLVLFFYGALAASGRAPWPDGMPTDWAWALALIGAGDAFLMPVLLARMWSGSDR